MHQNWSRQNEPLRTREKSVSQIPAILAGLLGERDDVALDAADELVVVGGQQGADALLEDPALEGDVKEDTHKWDCSVLLAIHWSFFMP